MKKLLFITTRLFWPADSGRKVVLYNYCKGLSEQLGFEVHLFSFLESGQTSGLVDSKPDFISSVKLAKPVSSYEKLANLCAATFDRAVPFQCCLFQSKANRELLSEYVERINPDVVMIDMVRLAPYLDGIAGHPSAKVVNFDDLLSKRYRRQLGKTGEGVLGKYGGQAGNLLKTVVAGPLKDRVLSIEAARCERAEYRYALAADASLLISPVEAGELADRTGLDSCFCATMGADISGDALQFASYAYDFGFVGNLHTAANQDSLKYVVEEVMPLLPGRSLRVIGVCPDEVRDGFSRHEQVSFTGRVDSIADHLGQCKVLLAPFAYGTGIKTKVLEAMGMGVPVVTNSIGLEGISAEVGREILCADDPDGLAHEALRLLENEELRVSVSQNGRGYVMRNHTWDESIVQLGKCIEYAEASFEGRVCP